MGEDTPFSRNVEIQVGTSATEVPTVEAVADERSRSRLGRQIFE